MTQPTLDVKDASGATVTIKTISPVGPASALDSRSVVLATEHLDAFSRLRVSQPTLLLDSKQVGGTPDLNATTAVTGSGAVVYTAARASTALTVGAAAGTAIRQTKSRAIYQPGKSLLLFQTFIMAPGQGNLIQRVGYFDTNNGIFLERDSGTLNITRRSFVTGAPVDVDVPQANWNLDTMDGSNSAANPSGILLDTTKPQILLMDLEWLGVGRVRVGFVVGGMIYYAHEFLNANATLTSVYMSNPNLPIRWEIQATAGIVGTATLESICGSMNSEGGYEITGITASADMGSTVNTLASGTFEEILAVRMKAGFTEFATAFLQKASVLATTDSNFLWRIVLNPTETVAGAWTDVSAGRSIMERNSTRTVTENTGLLIAAGYIAGSASDVSIDERPVLTLGTTLAGVTDVLSLQVRNLGAGPEDFLGSMTWREVF